MQAYTLTINCEVMNEMGVLVSHTLKTEAHLPPQPEDKFMFISRNYFKPIIIRIERILSSVTGNPFSEQVCLGEEIDEPYDIKEAFYGTWIMAD
ncbi:hypothetical protein ECE50_005300 [Chitinophaga sp. Mgbs1]|uniref:Uncharacterized protein n=1 Tax=Chitinophaga solisilvae TaxID=1233460 RepID=A0A3S1AWY2_9BACT|nr:hypothetical protein [Chitinophaga solisilvae]